MVAKNRRKSRANNTNTKDILLQLENNPASKVEKNSQGSQKKLRQNNQTNKKYKNRSKPIQLPSMLSSPQDGVGGSKKGADKEEQELKTKDSSEQTRLLSPEQSSTPPSSSSTFFSAQQHPQPPQDSKTHTEGSPAADFENLAKIFGGDLTFKELLLYIIALGFAGVTVIPTAIFSGSFMVAFVGLFKDLGNKDKEKVRLIAATFAAVVNGIINSKSLNGVGVEFYDKATRKTYYADKKTLQTVIIMLGMLGISGVGAIPNWQFVEDTIKGWSGETTLTMKILITLMNSVLNYRGLSALKTYSSTFTAEGKAEAEAAYAIRLALFKKLNSKLSENKLSEADLMLLASGKLYRDKYPILRQGLNIVAALAPVGYSTAFFIAAEDKLENFFNTEEEAARNIIAYYALMGITIGTATLAFLTKNFLLWNAIRRRGNILIDNLFSEEIIPTKTNWSPWITKPAILLRELTYLSITISSLAGADGTVLEYLFNDEMTYASAFVSMLLPLLAAGGINYGDTKDGVEGIVETVRRQTLKMFAETITINKDKFGENEDEFILNIMKLEASKPAISILNTYTEQRSHLTPSQTEAGVGDLDKKYSAINTGLQQSIPNLYVNKTFDSRYEEMNLLGNGRYQSFMENYQKPEPRKELNHDETDPRFTPLGKM